ncbi:MAG: hypothetical protein LC790_16675 [Actinobacteria bacterium]|nr:hypothetical protein [Actinomycetota bacterium]
MPEGEPGGGDPVALGASYERLRATVLAGRPEGFRLGHGVLIARGMAAFIATLPAPAAAAGVEAQVGERAELPAASVSALPCGGEVVAVLSEMALAHAA